MHHAFKLNGQEYNVELSRGRDGYRLHFDGRVIPIVPGNLPGLLATRGDQVFVHLNGEAYELQYQHPLVRLAAQGHGGADNSVRAPMPGAIVSVPVKAGDAVSKGQTLLVMESMKMETTITAPRDGVIEAVHFEKGQTFDRDALLLTLKSTPPPNPLPQGEGEKP